MITAAAHRKDPTGPEIIMYPYLRFAKVFVRAQWGHRLKIDDVGRLKMRVWPGDIDFYPEMNNGRHLTLMDLGRIDLAVRTGLMKTARRMGWGFVVAGASVRFRRRLRPFSGFTLLTRLLGRDGRWFYFHQRTVRDGRTCSSALVRAGLTSKAGLVAVSDVLAAMGAGDWASDLPDWVRAWIASDELRPYR